MNDMNIDPIFSISRVIYSDITNKNTHAFPGKFTPGLSAEKTPIWGKVEHGCGPPISVSWGKGEVYYRATMEIRT